jgi:type I restriction enzyme S subunit
MSDVWTHVVLGDVADLQRGVAYTSDQLVSPGTPFVTIKCFSKGGGFRKDEVKSFSGIVSTRDVLRPGDLIIANTDLTRDGSIVGAPALVSDVDPGTTFSMDVSRLNLATERVDSRFLAARLKLPDARTFMQGISGGSTVIHLHIGEVKRFPFLLPSLSEQLRINEGIEALDEQIIASDRAISKLQLVGEGLVDRILSQQDLDSVPSIGWVREKIGNVYDIQSGITLGPHRAPRRGAVGYLRVANVHRSLIDTSDISRLQASQSEKNSYRLMPGDLLLIRT